MLKSGTGQPNLANCSKLALHHTWRLPQGLAEQALVLRQNWMAASEKVGLHPRLSLGVPSHHIASPGPAISIVNAPRAFSAALYAFQFVVRYFLLCLFIVSVTPSVYGRRRGDSCTKAEGKRQPHSHMIRTAINACENGSALLQQTRPTPKKAVQAPIG